VLDLKIEGRTRKTLDPVAEHGHNVPGLWAFDAQDEDGDGEIEIAVAPAAGASDRNTILNVIWIFAGDASPNLEELRSGTSSRPALYRYECGLEQPTPGSPRNDILLLTFRNRGTAAATIVATLAQVRGFGG
jgi:hypothetical protein